MRIIHRKIIRKKRLQTRQDRIMTLANAISFIRILLSIPLILLLNEEKLWQAFMVIILIVLSDFLDGLARAVGLFCASSVVRSGAVVSTFR